MPASRLVSKRPLRHFPLIPHGTSLRLSMPASRLVSKRPLRHFPLIPHGTSLRLSMPASRLVSKRPLRRFPLIPHGTSLRLSMPARTKGPDVLKFSIRFFNDKYKMSIKIIIIFIYILKISKGSGNNAQGRLKSAPKYAGLENPTICFIFLDMEALAESEAQTSSKVFWLGFFSPPARLDSGPNYCIINHYGLDCIWPVNHGRNFFNCYCLSVYSVFLLYGCKD